MSGSNDQKIIKNKVRLLSAGDGHRGSAFCTSLFLARAYVERRSGSRLVSQSGGVGDNETRSARFSARGRTVRSLSDLRHLAAFSKHSSKLCVKDYDRARASRVLRVRDRRRVLPFDNVMRRV